MLLSKAFWYQYKQIARLLDFLTSNMEIKYRTSFQYLDNKKHQYTRHKLVNTLNDPIETKFVVPVKAVEKPLKLDDKTKTELQSIGMMDHKGKLKLKGVSPKMLKRMREKPIIFALANPEPEIDYYEAKAVRPDAIAATGRSDFPNQINNVLGFPYIFRGALDVRAVDPTAPGNTGADRCGRVDLIVRIDLRPEVRVADPVQGRTSTKRNGCVIPAEEGHAGWRIFIQRRKLFHSYGQLIFGQFKV